MEESSKLANHLGRYRLVLTLGQGGMGTIWLAVAGGLGEFRKLLVIKELRWDLTQNQRFVEMFLDEVKLAARLNHPNVVQTLEAGQEGHRYFLSMEFLDGQPLSEVMQTAARDPSITLAVRLRILCGALAGLHYAHELCDYDGTALQIVHRDISPHNIFVTYDGQTKVVDFGIAKAADVEAFTQPGVFKGKLGYASPEQVTGGLVDRRADIFAMGVVLWELVTLQRFAKGKASQAAFDTRCAGREPRLSQLDFDVEPLLAEICDRAVHVDPAKRFATAEEFRVAIEQYLFVSGERVDSSAIAAIMQSAFADERSAMHRMIDLQLKDADYSESLVRQLRPVQSTLSSEDPTTVADLSELVESSRADLPTRSERETAPGWNRSLRGQSNAVWWVVAALVAAGAAAAYIMPRMHPSEAPAVSAPSASPPPATSGPAAPPVPAIAAPAIAAPPAERAQSPSTPAAVAPEPPATPASQSSGSERAARRARRASAASDSDRESDSEAESSGGGFLFGFVDSYDRESTGEVDEAALSEKPAASLRIVPSADADLSKRAAEEDPALQPAPVDVGEDLRRLRREQRRALDTEDPFK
jgi:serine/threonine-protein kinase